MTRIVVLAQPDAIPPGLVDFYRARGDEVILLAAQSEHDLALAISPLAMQPVDLLICALPAPPAAMRAAVVSRERLTQGLHDLAFLPFRAAALLRPNLALAKGRAALVTSDRATMTYEDKEGLYEWRPFLAATHALWRCMAIEWREDGITCPLIAVEGNEHPASLAKQIEKAPNGSLIDTRGDVIGW